MGAEKVFEDDGGEAGGVGAEKKEEGAGSEETGTEGEGFGEGFFDFVEFAFGAAAEGGGIEDDGVVAAIAFDFAVKEFVDVVDDPADGGGLELVEFGIFAGPFDHAFGGVDVADVGSGMGGGKGGTTGVGEEVEDGGGWGGVGAVGEALANPGPALPLLGEDAEVAEVGAGEFEADAVDGDVPVVGKAVATAPAVAFSPVEGGMGAGPWVGGEAGRPDGLGAGADEGYGAEAFEFLAVAAVEELVVGGHEGAGILAAGRRDYE